MTRAKRVDIGSFLPVYYNGSSANQEKVPSHVLCYNTGVADHWCLRPVEHGGPPNNDVVTMYSREWRVRVSIVRVRTKDLGLQAKLRKIGYGVLEDGLDKGLVAASVGAGPFVVMGRNELTRFDESGTPLFGIKYCQGFIEEEQTANVDEASAEVVTADISTEPEQDFRKVNVVSKSASSSSPDAKKPKIV